MPDAPDETRAQAGAQEHEETPEDEDEGFETPFDHPLFLPVVLFGLSLWFLWDGFIVPMEDHLSFNRWGFAVLATATAWFGYKGIREMRENRSRDEAGPSHGEDNSPIS